MARSGGKLSGLLMLAARACTEHGAACALKGTPRQPPSSCHFSSGVASSISAVDHRARSLLQVQHRLSSAVALSGRSSEQPTAQRRGISGLNSAPVHGAHRAAPRAVAPAAAVQVEQSRHGHPDLGTAAPWPQRDSSARSAGVVHVPGEPQPRCLLQAALVGAPNAGKSTLTNALVGQKVTAVSPKTNTTAAVRLGAFTHGQTQVVLHDTPGVVAPSSLRGTRHEHRVRSAWNTAAEADLLVFLIDAHRQLAEPDPRVTRLVSDLGEGRPLGSARGWTAPPAVLVLNKVDLLRGEAARSGLLELTDSLRRLAPFEEVFPVSAARGHGVSELAEHLLSRARPGRWLLDEGEPTDQSDAEMAAELVREQMFRYLHQEVPYALQVVPVSQRTLRDGSVRLEQVIWVPNETVRAMVLGKNGEVIGKIGIAARAQLQEYLQNAVHLIVNVKVDRKNRH